MGLIVYFVTIFIPFNKGCDIYENNHNACISLKMISIIGMITLVAIALSLGINIIIIIFTCFCNPVIGCKLFGEMIKQIFELFSTCCCTCNKRRQVEPQFPAQNLENNQRQQPQNELLNMLNRYAMSYLPISSVPPPDDVCAICTDDTTPNMQWKELPCKHKFHPQCIDPWILGHQTCPLCRHRVLIPAQQV